MDVFSIKEYQERFDEIVERVEHGETIGIVGDDGEAAVLICRDQYHAAMDSIEIHEKNNNAH
jgi:PHD/YefM family antitoxin component YafN of YafNO toxin-antitoxin module|tara:strand:- start:219 stop:404 length:186 start_codon:yes stop_codon:yes gene_type:complete